MLGSVRRCWQLLRGRCRPHLSSASCSPCFRSWLPGASALGWAASRVSGQQKACSRVWGTETQGAKQLLLWNKGPKGTPIR